MVDQADFKHIKVNSGDDDDIVIMAGISEPAQNDVEAETEIEIEIEIEAVPDSKPSEPQVESVPKSVEPSASADKVHAARTQQPKDAYHPTTLEDIQSTKMPKAQIITIVLAVLAIAAFVIWYVVFS